MAIRRPTKVARKQEPIKHSEENIIYAWPVKSMTNRQAFGGKTVTYAVVMYKDGQLYCNCAAWQFAKETKIEAIGFQNNACLKETKELEEALGKVEKRELKAEARIPEQQAGITTKVGG